MPLRYRYRALLYFLLQGSMLFAQRYLPESHHDYVLAREVYEKVWSAYGHQSAPPKLEIRKGVGAARDVAFYKNGVGKSGPVIVLDAEVIPHLSAVFGAEAPAALACILSHELAHHYYRHSKTSHFASRSTSPVQEAQADESGFFYAYLAGYPSFSVAERLFDTLYEQYGFERRGTAEYPSRKERLALVREKINEVMVWANVYEAGKVLMLAGKTGEAIACLETVATQRLSVPEVYRNLGVSYLLAVMGKLWVSREEMPFMLPVEPDMSTRLLVQSRGISEADQRERDRLLRNAEKYLLQASLAGGNASTDVNLAIAQLLLGNTAAAIGTLNKLDLNLPDAILVRGIAYLKEGRMEKAATDFRRIEKEPGLLFETNRQVYREVTTKGWKGVAYQPAKAVRGLRGMFTEKLPAAPELWVPPPVSEVPFPISVNRTGFGDLYRFSLPAQKGRGYEEWRIARVTNKGFDNRKQIRIGEPAQRLTAEGGYGRPDYILGSETGRAYYVYQSMSVIFMLDRQKIAGWYVFERLR
ncbi:hypothetical protein [Ravibacter arvi]